MRRALSAYPATAPTSVSETIPSPVGGWNARDSLAAMPIQDAERLINWFPEATYVRTRPGTDAWFTGFSGQAETLMSYAGTTTLELFVVESVNIWKATATGQSASAGALMLSSRTNARYQYTNFATPGGNFMICVNGADQPLKYDGSTFSAMSTLSAISGSAHNFINVHAFAQRLFFVEKDTLNFYYMDATEVIAGSAHRFPLGSQFDMGGTLLATGSWTRDGGDGMDDIFVAVTDQGEAIVYQGTDPSSSSTWSKVGLYKIPKPLGHRCLTKYGGDLLVLTEGGVLPMSMVLSGIEPQKLVTDKIHPAVSDAVRMHRANYGWQIKYYPLGHWLMVNVPVKEGDKQQQYVMNTNTGAWCQFKGMEANCWEIHNNKLFFGSSTKVYQADTGTNDDGTNRDVDAKQAPWDFGYAGVKNFTLIRPFINSDNTVPVAIGLNIDFNDRSPVSTPTPVATTIPHWGSATWGDYQWAGKPVPQGSIQSGGGAGVYAAMRLKGAVNTDLLQWNATQVIFQRGQYV